MCIRWHLNTTECDDAQNLTCLHSINRCARVHNMLHCAIVGIGIFCAITTAAHQRRRVSAQAPEFWFHQHCHDDAQTICMHHTSPASAHTHCLRSLHGKSFELAAYHLRCSIQKGKPDVTYGRNSTWNPKTRLIHKNNNTNHPTPPPNTTRSRQNHCNMAALYTALSQNLSRVAKQSC